MTLSRGRRSWKRWTLLAVLSLALAGLWVYYGLLPILARSKVRQLLEGMGVHGARFEVVNVTPWSLTLRGPTLPDGSMSVAMTEVTFTPALLREGRVDEVTLLGASVDLPTLILASHAEKSSGVWPLRKLRVERAVLRKLRADEDWQLPLSVIVTPEPDGRSVSVEARTSLAMLPVAAQARVGPSTVHGAAVVGDIGIESEMKDGVFRFRLKQPLLPGSAIEGRLALDTGHWQVRASVDESINADTIRGLSSLLQGELARRGWALQAQERRWSLAQGAWHFSSDRAAVRGDLSYSSQHGFAGQLALEVQAGELHHRDSGLTLRAVEVQLPVTWGVEDSARPTPGRFGAQVDFLDRPWPALAGTCALHEGVLRWETPWTESSQGVSLFTRGEVSLPQRTGEFRGSVQGLIIDDPKALARRFTALRGIDLTGQLDAHAVVSLTGGDLKPWITLDITEGRVASGEFDTLATGVAAQVNFDRFTPLATPPFQWVSVREAHVGKLAVRDGIVQFQMRGLNSVMIERTRWAVGEKGAFQVHAFWMNPAAEELPVEVFMEDVDIRDLLGLVAEKSVEGQGLLYGRLPVTIRPTPGEKPLISPGSGFLYSRPGVGWFQVLDRSTLDKLSSEELGVGDQVRQRIVRALTNFEYETLRLEFLHQPGEEGLLLQVEIAGHGRDDPQLLQIRRLTFNIRGVEKLLDLALRVRAATP